MAGLIRKGSPMKKITAVILIAVLLLGTLSLAGCGRKELTVTVNDGRLMILEANRAAKGDFLMTGTLEVAEGEKIVITSGLEKGEIKIEIVTLGGMDDINTVPDPDNAEVILSGNMAPGKSVSATMSAGDYMMRATVTVKATGTVTIEVMPAD